MIQNRLEHKQLSQDLEVLRAHECDYSSKEEEYKLKLYNHSKEHLAERHRLKTLLSESENENLLLKNKISTLEQGDKEKEPANQELIASSESHQDNDLVNVNKDSENQKRPYLKVVEELINSPEIKNQAKERVDRYFDKKYADFAPYMDPEEREKFLSYLRGKSEELGAKHMGVWLTSGENRKAMREEIKKEWEHLDKDIKEKFGDHVYETYKDHNLKVSSRETLERVKFLKKEEDKMDQIVDIMVDVKKSNDVKREVNYRQLFSMNEEQFKKYEENQRQLIADVVDRSRWVLNDEEIGLLKTSLESNHEKVARRVKKHQKRIQERSTK